MKIEARQLSLAYYMDNFKILFQVHAIAKACRLLLGRLFLHAADGSELTSNSMGRLPSVEQRSRSRCVAGVCHPSFQERRPTQLLAKL